MTRDVDFSALRCSDGRPALRKYGALHAFLPFRRRATVTLPASNVTVAQLRGQRARRPSGFVVVGLTDHAREKKNVQDQGAFTVRD